MPTVVREDLGNLHAVLSITIEQADYSKKFEDEIQKLQKKAQLKGFRKGKTPLSLVKKLYGRGVLVDTINDLVQDALFDYLNNGEVQILGQPIQSESQELYDFDPKDAGDFVFKFDIGLSPEFELQGLEASSAFEMPVIDVTPEMVDEDLNHFLTRNATRVEVGPPYENKDLLTLTALQLGADGAVMEEGHSAKFSLLLEDASDAAKAALKDLPEGGTVQFDIYALENDRDEAFVRRYFLHLDENDDRDYGRVFELSVEKAERSVPRELNQEFFDEAFGPDQVHNEEEMREFIRKNIAGYYQSNSEALLFRDIQNRLMELNALSLPDDFLRRWIQRSNEKADAETIEREYPIFAKNLQWSLIRNKIADRFQIRVSQEEIVNRFKAQVAGYFNQMPGLGDAFLNNMAERLMQDEKQVERVAEEILSDKVFDAVRSAVTVTPKTISLEAFNALSEQARAEAMANRQTLMNEEEE